MKRVKITSSEKQTFDFAKKFARQLEGGEVIGLNGELGAGKTVFIKGLAKGLGIKKIITSPTFVLMKIYKIENSTCGLGSRACRTKTRYQISHREICAPARPRSSDIRRTPWPLGLRDGFFSVKPCGLGSKNIENCKLKIENLCHIDAYRLKSAQDLVDIGIYDWLGREDTITVIEWADKVKRILPKNKIMIKFKFGKEKNGRVINYG